MFKLLPFGFLKPVARPVFVRQYNYDGVGMWSINFRKPNLCLSFKNENNQVVVSVYRPRNMVIAHVIRKISYTTCIVEQIHKRIIVQRHVKYVTPTILI